MRARCAWQWERRRDSIDPIAFVTDGVVAVRSEGDVDERYTKGILGRGRGEKRGDGSKVPELAGAVEEELSFEVDILPEWSRFHQPY